MIDRVITGVHLHNGIGCANDDHGAHCGSTGKARLLVCAFIRGWRRMRDGAAYVRLVWQCRRNLGMIVLCRHLSRTIIVNNGAINR